MLKDPQVQGRDPVRAGGADPLPRHEPEPLRAVQGQAGARGDLPLVRPRRSGQGPLRRRRRAALRPDHARRRRLQPEREAHPVRSGAGEAAHGRRRLSRTARACRRSKITCEPNFKDELAYYADQFKKVLGMPVEMEIQERATFIKRMNAGEVPFFPWGWTADYPDAMYFLSQVWYGPSPYNRARWKNAEFDQLIDRAQATRRRAGALQALPHGRAGAAHGLGHVSARRPHADRAPEAERPGSAPHALPVPAVQHRHAQLIAAAPPLRRR